MRRLFFLFFVIILIFPESHAQESKRSNVWYFGNNAGISFNSGKPVSLADGMMTQREGCASICDENGRILLYTNGIQIWNGKHKVISGDTQLGGDDTSTQSAVIVPKPGSSTIFYVFTTFRQLICVTVDITLNKGNGGITSKTVLLENSTEKLAAVSHCNQKDFWILAHENENNVFRSFLLTSGGLEKTGVVSKAGTDFDYYKSVGNMKFSPAADRLGMAVFGKSCYELFDFDNSSGIVSNPVSLVHKDFQLAYGLEFSPNGKFIYVCEVATVSSPIFQLDISSATVEKILKSKIEIGRTRESNFGSLQLGPDRKIYVSRIGSRYLGVINNPDLQGYKCGYVNDGMKLIKGTSGLGFPNGVVSLPKIQPSVQLIKDNHCNDVTLRADYLPESSRVVYQWYKGDSLLADVHGDTYKPAGSGMYSVIAMDTRCFEKPVYSKSVDVNILSINPVLTKVSCGVIRFAANANANAGVQWTGPGMGEVDNQLHTITIEGFGKQYYTVKVSDPGDASCYIEKKITADFGICDAQLFIPDIFTPNKDGINEVFKIEVRSGEALQLSIFNRWGNNIFTSNGRDAQWDGKVDGAESLIGVYTFILQYKNVRGQQFSRKGTVILQR